MPNKHITYNDKDSKIKQHKNKSKIKTKNLVYQQFTQSD